MSGLDHLLADPAFVLALIALMGALTAFLNSRTRTNTLTTRADQNTAHIGYVDKRLNGELTNRIAATAAFAVAFREANGRAPSPSELIASATPTPPTAPASPPPALVIPGEEVSHG